MISTLQSGDLFEQDVSDSSKTEDNIRIAQANDFLSQFSYLQDKKRLYNDNLYKVSQNTTNKKSIGYQRFLGKFKKSDY
jgi:hypothetical protein